MKIRCACAPDCDRRVIYAKTGRKPYHPICRARIEKARRKSYALAYVRLTRSDRIYRDDRMAQPVAA